MNPSTAITGATTSTGAPSSSDAVDRSSSILANGYPAPPVAQKTPSTPYAKDQRAVAHPIQIDQFFRMDPAWFVRCVSGSLLRAIGFPRTGERAGGNV
ncbi:hypothetical protein GCM10027269_58070 [Kribbella endophytica]